MILILLQDHCVIMWKISVYRRETYPRISVYRRETYPKISVYREGKPSPESQCKERGNLAQNLRV